MSGYASLTQPTFERRYLKVKLLREPLVHFMFIGAAIYLLNGVFAEPEQEETDKTIIVSAGEV